MSRKNQSPTRKKDGAPATLHPTVGAVVRYLYHLPAIRCAVWECTTIPEATKETPKEDLHPHKFVRILQHLFLKIHRSEPWTVDDMQWSLKIAAQPPYMLFDYCRNYMVCAYVFATCRWPPMV